MTRASEVERRLRSLAALAEAVSAMKSLSAHHFRAARAAVEPARIYREGVERVAVRAGATLAGGDGPAGLLVIGAEHGLCGGYDARVVAAALHQREALGPGPTFCVGRHAAMLLSRRGVDLHATYGLPTSVVGLPDVLLRLAQDLVTTWTDARLSRLDAVANPFVGVGTIEPVTSRLLPLKPTGARPREPGAGARYVDADHLASTAVRELLHAMLYGLVLDGLASEHASRLVATQSAERWLDARTARLRRRLAATRRERRTQETIEIASGVRARASRRRPGR